MIDILSLLHPYLAISAGFLNLSLALWIFFNAPKNSGNLAFSITSFMIAGYLIFFNIPSLLPTDSFDMILYKTGEVMVHQISPSFYCFSVFFLGLSKQKKASLMFPAFCLLVITPMVFSMEGSHIGEHWWGKFLVRPFGSNKIKALIYFIPFLGLMLASLVNFILAFRQEQNPNRKLQIKYIIVAFLIAYIGALDHLTWLGFDHYAFGFLPLSILTLTIAYTIVRHNLLDINVMFRRISLIVLIYLSLFTLIFPVIIFLRKYIDITRFSNPLDLVLILSFPFGLILSMGPIIYMFLLRRNLWIKSHMGQGFTHELKSPLVSIQGVTELLKSKVPEDKPENKEIHDYIKIIEKNSNRLDKLVANLLNVAAIQEGRFTINKSKTNLTQLIQNEISYYSEEAQNNKSNLSFNGKDEVFAEIDPEKFQQVISNLLSNALKYAKEKEIQVKISNQNNEILVSIQDNGVGIPEDEINKIFDRFYHGKYSSKGTGIGLTIAKAWVEAHGGKTWAESEGEGKGTKISFTLPANQ